MSAGERSFLPRAAAAATGGALASLAFPPAGILAAGLRGRRPAAVGAPWRPRRDGGHARGAVGPRRLRRHLVLDRQVRGQRLVGAHPPVRRLHRALRRDRSRPRPRAVLVGERGTRGLALDGPRVAPRPMAARWVHVGHPGGLAGGRPLPAAPGGGRGRLGALFRHRRGQRRAAARVHGGAHDRIAQARAGRTGGRARGRASAARLPARRGSAGRCRGRTGRLARPGRDVVGRPGPDRRASVPAGTRGPRHAGTRRPSRPHPVGGGSARSSGRLLAGPDGCGDAHGGRDRCPHGDRRGPRRTGRVPVHEHDRVRR